MFAVGGLFFKLGQWLISGGLQSAVDAYKAKLAAGNTQERIAADLAGKELDLQQREKELNTQYKIAIIGHWYEPVQLMGYIMVSYLGKGIFWDKVVLGDWINGNTDPIRGDLLTWAGAIMLFYVGQRTVANALAFWRRK